MNRYITYYRVSTQKQGQSGLGLNAQKSAIEKFTNNCRDCIIAEYTEIESGKRNDRPQLKRAIDESKKNNCKLLIAKLDRLSRNAAFIFTLRDADVDFVCADMPDANRLTISILAVLAQDERERISQRTKAALQEARKRGQKLGTPSNLTQKAIEKGRCIRKQNALDNENNKRASALIVSMRKSGQSFYTITKTLNDGGFKTSKGKEFQLIQAQRLYDSATLLKKSA